MKKESQENKSPIYINIAPVLEKYKDYENFTGHREYDEGFDTGVFAVINFIEELINESDKKQEGI